MGAPGSGPPPAAAGQVGARRKGGGGVEHTTGYLQGDVPLFYQAWRPARPAGAPMVLAHGMGEHSGRYDHVARYLASRGVPVWALDHRGHGRSGGRRLFVRRFGEYLGDLDRFVAHVAAAEGGRPVLVGHSMGGLIALSYALERPDALAAVAVSSPWLATRARIPPLLRLATPLLAVVAPALPVPQPPNPNALTRDPAMAQRYLEDPLIARVATPRWFVECVRQQRRLLPRARELWLPALFLVAGDDPLVDPDVTRRFYEAVPDPKAWRYYPDRRHEVFNDLGRDQVLADLWQWLVDQGLAEDGHWTQAQTDR